jgi:hypothetical protein
MVHNQNTVCATHSYHSHLCTTVKQPEHLYDLQPRKAHQIITEVLHNLIYST